MSSNKVKEKTMGVPDSFCTLIKWRDMEDEDAEGTENPE